MGAVEERVADVRMQACTWRAVGGGEQTSATRSRGAKSPASVRRESGGRRALEMTGNGLSAFGGG